MRVLTQRDVVVPAVTSCSRIMRREEVRMETSMPRWRAARMAERTGGEVMFGLWILMVFSALDSSVRMKALSGVGGAVTPSVDANG